MNKYSGKGNKRAGYRVDVALPVELLIKDTNGKILQINMMSNNISIGGISVKNNDLFFLSEGDSVLLHFKFGESSVTVVSLVKVVRENTVGFQFKAVVELDPPSHNNDKHFVTLLNKFIFEEQRKKIW